jgi:hypothetical protein
MGVLKVLINGVWTPVGGSNMFISGGGYETALINVTSDGQQIFTIPEHNGADNTIVFLNGIQYNYLENDYTIAGTTLTWADNKLKTGDTLFLFYSPLSSD